MALNLNCPHCGCLVMLPDPAPGQSYAGKKGRCLSCGGTVDLGTAIGDDALSLVKETAAPAAPKPAPAVPQNPYSPASFAPPVPKRGMSKGAWAAIIIVVVVVLGIGAVGVVTILAAIALPAFSGARNAGRAVAAQSNGVQIVKTQALFKDSHGFYAQHLSDLPELGPQITNAEAPPGPGLPTAGYVFKVLTKQGANAPGGAKSYIDTNNNMTGGFALLAYPASMSGSRNTIMLFSADGATYTMDVSPNLAEKVKDLDFFDPNPNWKRAKVEQE